VHERAFQVDLRGVVDLLSHHLYSSPRVFARELLQNAADALTARTAGAADTDARVVLIPSDVAADGRLHCIDSGVGLTPDDVERFLATIGSSSKRDDLGFARTDLLGQFGIGLLSCFLVCDEIEVVSRSAQGGHPVRWFGRSDGTYSVEELRDAGLPDVVATLGPGLDPRELTGPAGATPGCGTWVSLAPRPGSAEWTTSQQLLALATEFGQMLPWDIRVARPAPLPPVRVTVVPPWQDRNPNRTEVETLLGVSALALLPISVPEAGLRGLAAVVGQPTAPTTQQAHRVYVKGMLVGRTVDSLVPEWAFFVRCLVNSDQLRLTASRESLYEDDLLEHVRESIGEQVRRWMFRTAEVDPRRFEAFCDLHALAVKSVASTDDDLLRAVLPWLRFETTLGPMTLPEVSARSGVIRYAGSVEEYRQIAAVAGAQGVGVVNAGYAFDTALIGRVAGLDDQLLVEAIVPGDLDAHVRTVPENVALALRPFLTAAREVLDHLDVDVELREFAPVTLPALVLDDREARHRRASREAAQSDDVWGQLLASLDDGSNGRRRLLLNHRNTVVHRITRITDRGLLGVAVEALYCQALLTGQHPMGPAENVVLQRSFVAMLDRAVSPR
jgi:molecular chaperone HtpG